MKAKTIRKDTSPLAELRLVRDKISAELKGMTAEQMVAFLKKKKTLHPKSVWR
jgi:hypothetical protein